MNLSVSKDSLVSLLYVTLNIVERKTTMPILSNVKLSASENTLTVSATDMEVSFLGKTEAEVRTPGSITLSGKMFYEIVKELPGDTVNLNLGPANRMEIESQLAKFKITGVSAEEFPSIKGVSVDQPVAVDAKLLLEMVERTAFAMATDESRFNINGLCIEQVPGTKAGEGMIRIVATDGHRLAFIDREVSGVELKESKIIPRKGIYELIKVLQKNEGVAHIGFQEGFFTVISGGSSLGIRLVDGEYPDYKQIVPAQSRTIVKVDRSELHSAVKRMSIVCAEKSRSVKMAITKEELILSSASAELGEARQVIPVELQGEELTIAFSGIYLLDLLSAMPSADQIEMRLDGENNAGVFKSAGDDHYLCIVMPMRIDH